MLLVSATATTMILLAGGDPPRPGAPGQDRVIILSDTGQTREGLTIVEVHPGAAAQHEMVLNRGYARRLARLYRAAQRFVRPDVAPQPAYLVLSDNQGGFPRYGFVLDDTPQPHAAYVDLHRRSAPSGRAGAVDQIFPHELLHIIVRDLAGSSPEGHATQVHAIGVRTDRVTAFNEGFAEHGQLMAIDDPEAAAETRAIASDADLHTWAMDNMHGYRRALAARWSVAAKHRMTFPFWFSQSEQVLRYHAVRENLFAYDVRVPDRLLANGNAYRAYLLENVLPGERGGPPKSAGRMLATEGVISALFYRIVTDAAVQRAYSVPGFYERFGAARDTVDLLDNAYLKVFAAIRAGGYDALAVVRAHQRLFPEDAPAIERILRDTLLNQPLPAAGELWMRNDAFTAGRSLFDQFKGVPRTHAFDLNACSPADLAGVPGLRREVADSIRRAAPFDRLEDLRRARGVDDEAFRTFVRMRAAMENPPPPGTASEGQLTFTSVLMPYAWRALYVLIGCAAAAAALYRAVRRVGCWRLPFNGFAAALVGLLAGWTVDPGTGLLAFATPILLFGVPGALIRLWRTRSPRQAALVVGAWAGAAIPAAVAVVPIG